MSTPTTPQNQQEALLHLEEDRYHSFFEGVPVGLALSTPQGDILDVNAALVQMLRFPNREAYLKSKAPVMYVHPEDRERVITIIDKDGIVRDFETQLRCYDGTPIWVRFNLRVVRDPQGEATYFESAVIDVTERKRAEEVIARQAREIIEMSTPVVQVWEGVVLATLIGTLDSERTQQLMDRLLESIVETRSSVAVVDITGVPAIDTQTARHLIDTMSSVRLLGAQAVLTGIRPEIAQTLVHLDVDLTNVITRSSLAAGLRYSLEALDLQITRR